VDKLGGYAEIFPGFAFESERFTDDPSNVALVKGENVQQGFIDWNASKYWPAIDADFHSKFELRAGDVVLAMDRPWVTAGLKWAYIKKHDPKALLVQRVSRLRAKNGLDQTYLRCLISSRYFSDYIQPIVTGVNVPHISGRQIGSFKIPLPPPPLQKKIAATISAYDELIENNRQRIALLEKLAEEIYREWFVRLRFPGHANVKSVKGLPMGWQQLRILDFARCKYGYTESAVENDQLPKFLRVMDINKASFISWSEVPNCPIPDLEFEKLRLSKDDVVIARMADPGKVAIVEQEVNAVFASYLIKIAYDRKQITPYYLFYTLRTDAYSGYFAGANSGATRGSINGTLIGKTRIIVPTRDLLDQFDTIVRPIRAKLNNCVQQIELLSKMRNQLLPRLISGKLPVENLAIQFPPGMAEEMA
jgi:type I restriction enzyme S subunit